MGTRKVFVYPADSYLGRSLGPELQVRLQMMYKKLLNEDALAWRKAESLDVNPS